MFQRASNIPDSVRADLAEVIERTAHQIEFRQPDMVYLFEVYNRYLNRPGETEDINCGGCRTKVVGKLRALVKSWKQPHGESR
jgi:hypothetical protein